MPSEKKVTQQRGFLYILSLLLFAAQMQAPAWQASGSFEVGQLEFVRATIDSALDSSLARSVIAVNISD